MLSKESFFSPDKVILFLISLIFIVTFNLSPSLGSYPFFYIDTIGCIIILLCLFLVSYDSNLGLLRKPPKVCLGYGALAIYWFIHPLFVDVPYISQNFNTALFFLIVSFFTWAIHSFAFLRKDSVFIVMCWGILVGVLIQGVIIVLQSTVNLSSVDWFLNNNGSVNGQMGQRNLLAHYIMWSFPAVAYLRSIKKLSLIVTLLTVLILSFLLALVNSRSIIIYLFIFACLGLAYYIFSREQRRMSIILLASLVTIMAFQVLVPLLLQYVNIESESAIGRLAHHSSIDLRLMEWRKAWEIFKEYPFFGIGWKSYTYYSLVWDESIVPDSFIHLQGHYTHSHNIFLQLLSEMGGVGCFLVVAVLVWVGSPLLYSFKSNTSFLLLLLIGVTLSHSLVEFPLWYSNYFIAFAIFLSLIDIRKNNSEKKITRTSRIMTIFSSLGLLYFIVLFSIFSQTIENYMTKFPNQLNKGVFNMNAVGRLGEYTPLLSIYTDIAKLPNISAIGETISPEDIAVISRLNKVRPISSIALQNGYLLYRQGKVEEATRWLEKTWHYYPRTVVRSMRTIYDNSPMFKKLELPVYKACQKYKKTQLYPKTFNAKCPSSPDVLRALRDKEKK